MMGKAATLKKVRSVQRKETYKNLNKFAEGLFRDLNNRPLKHRAVFAFKVLIGRV